MKRMQRDSQFTEKGKEDVVVDHHNICDRLSEEIPVNSGRRAVKNELKTSIAERIFVDRGILCIENLARLPLERCIKTNLPTDKVVRVHLRNPFQPRTWWGKRSRRLTFGISNRAWTQHRVMETLSWTSQISALVAFGFGIFFSPLFLFVCPVGLILGGVLRSISPIWATHATRELNLVRGVDSSFGHQFDQYDRGEPLN